MEIRHRDTRALLLRVPGSLVRADLGGASLRYANLRGAGLGGTDLRAVDLRGADLRGAGLAGADLREAILTGADLRGAFLWHADLRGARIDGTRWASALYDETTAWPARFDPKRHGCAHARQPGEVVPAGAVD